MQIVPQIKLALIDSQCAMRHMRKQSFSWMTIYLAIGLMLFALCSWQLLSHEQDIKNLILDYLFPQSWHSISEDIVRYFYEKQAKIVIANMILGASLVVASVFLFPIKEKFSEYFEREAGYQNGAKEEFPLWEQGIEEARILLLYLAAQCVILWIGYYPWPFTQWLSIGLSYFFLFFTFGLDFISPTLQRHKQSYAVILKALGKKVCLVVTFGALYSLPTVMLARIMFEFESLSLLEVSGILFLVNMLFLTLAIPAGTHIASKLMQEVKSTSAPSKRTMRIGVTSIFLILVAGLYLHSSLFKSVHHKTQLLKAEYSVDWGSFDLSMPTLGALFSSKSLTKLSFDLQIHNPTEFDIVIENSELYIEKQDKHIAQVDLDGFAIPAGETRLVNIKLDSVSDFGKINELSSLLEGWRIYLHMDVWRGIPFIMNIYQAEEESEGDD